MVIDREEEGLYEYRVTSCLFFRFFKQMGCPELCTIMCAIDNAIFNSYLPNEIVFTRYPGETMAEGARDCRFRLARR